MHVKFGTLLALSFWLGCGSEAYERTDADAILGGRAENDYQAAGFLSFQFPDGGWYEPFCSATLIAPDRVLTSAHCVQGDGTDLRPGQKEARRWAFQSGAVGGAEPKIAARLIRTEPRYSPAVHDLAVLELESVYPNATSAELDTQTLHIDCNYRMVGYGYDEAGGYGARKSAQICLDSTQPNGTYIAYGLDGSACGGDSGAGVFREGSNQLVAVHRGSYCRLESVLQGTLIAPHLDFIFDRQHTADCGSLQAKYTTCLAGNDTSENNVGEISSDEHHAICLQSPSPAGCVACIQEANACTGFSSFDCQMACGQCETLTQNDCQAHSTWCTWQANTQLCQARSPVEHPQPTTWLQTSIQASAHDIWLSGQFDTDSWADLVHIEPALLSATLYHNQQGSFGPRVISWPPLSSLTAHRWFAADLNGDGLSDLAAVAPDPTQTIEVYFNNDGIFQHQTWPVDPLPEGTPSVWLVGDFDADTRDDFARLSPDSRAQTNIDIFLSSGQGLSKQRWLHQRGLFTGRQFVAGNFDSNPGDDIAVIWSDAGQSTINVYRNARGRFVSLRYQTQGQTMTPNATWLRGQFDRVGHDDLLQVQPEVTGQNFLNLHRSVEQSFRTTLWTRTPSSSSDIWLSGEFFGQGRDAAARITIQEGVLTITMLSEP